ncbi:lipopolysaccharide modification acyltransferase [Sulfuriferula multivorans]|uniref:Lipopolysaccharide modification acyltransferase n=1 Tax=Sulfuriferula multivorans TaxID=1559896 RepID=A0A401JG85_9PROT|nr:acyltransferase [Sulfuriferula multivorans]GBL46618.1 lipopolysaccharide modification acyltransferase [Sulfuriferula multivorans]
MLTITNQIPYFVISCLLLLIAAILLHSSSFYQSQVSDTQDKYLSLDGLRGFLALGVFFHHAVIFYFFYATGIWEVPPSRFYTLLGQSAVALFFMITGFLFWSKAIRAKGRINVKSLLNSRVKRLLPMYIVSVLVVFGVAYVAGGFMLRSSYPRLAMTMLHWMSFGFMDQPDINGLGNSWLINSVYWTLRYEWIFYLLLPLLAWAYRDIAFFVLAALTAVLVLKYSLHIVLLCFIFGAVTAWLLDKSEQKFNRLLQGSVATLLASGLLMILFWRFDTAYSIQAELILFGIFFIVVSGNNLFGLLTSKPARAVGAMSYSIYLLHSPILFLLLYMVNLALPIKGMQAVQYWGVIALAGTVLILASSVTYRFVEYPYMRRRVS